MPAYESMHNQSTHSGQAKQHAQRPAGQPNAARRNTQGNKTNQSKGAAWHAQGDGTLHSHVFPKPPAATRPLKKNALFLYVIYRSLDLSSRRRNETKRTGLGIKGVVNWNILDKGRLLLSLPFAHRTHALFD